jgi:hypothetical protein
MRANTDKMQYYSQNMLYMVPIALLTRMDATAIQCEATFVWPSEWLLYGGFVLSFAWIIMFI